MAFEDNNNIIDDNSGGRVYLWAKGNENPNTPETL